MLVVHGVSSQAGAGYRNVPGPIPIGIDITVEWVAQSRGTPMDQITVVYSRSRSIGGLLIRAASWWEQWTHCGIVTEDYSVIEARAFHGVVETPWDEFRDRYTTLERVRVNCPAPQSGIAWARSRLGSGYDYGALAEIVLRNPMQDGDRYQCAELVESALIAASRFRFRKQPHQVTVAQSYMVR